MGDYFIELLSISGFCFVIESNLDRHSASVMREIIDSGSFFKDHGLYKIYFEDSLPNGKYKFKPLSEIVEESNMVNVKYFLY